MDTNDPKNPFYKMSEEQVDVLKEFCKNFRIEITTKYGSTFLTAKAAFTMGWEASKSDAKKPSEQHDQT